MAAWELPYAMIPLPFGKLLQPQNFYPWLLLLSAVLRSIRLPHLGQEELLSLSIHRDSPHVTRHSRESFKSFSINRGSAGDRKSSSAGLSAPCHSKRKQQKASLLWKRSPKAESDIVKEICLQRGCVPFFLLGKHLIWSNGSIGNIDFYILIL